MYNKMDMVARQKLIFFFLFKRWMFFLDMIETKNGLHFLVFKKLKNSDTDNCFYGKY